MLMVNRIEKYKNVVMKGFRIQVCIYNCNIEFLNSIMEQLGGKIRSNNINMKHKKCRNCMVYKATDNRAIQLINNILPYLIIKKEQALIAIKAAKIKSRYNVAEKIWHPEFKEECNDALSALKLKINKLNIRGIKKKFKSKQVKKIPFNIHYLAGFCDADGSIMIIKQGNNIVPKLNFTNTNKNVIDWIKHYMGGNLYTKLRTNKKWNTAYELTFTSKKAANLAKLLIQHLKLKKQQAKVVIEFDKIKGKFSSSTLRWNKKLNIRHKKNKEKLRLICSKLNKRGQ
jgi:hypothetical protein